MSFAESQYDVVLLYPPAEQIVEIYDVPEFPHIGIALQEILDLSDKERNKTVTTLEDVLHKSRKF